MSKFKIGEFVYFFDNENIHNGEVEGNIGGEYIIKGHPKCVNTEFIFKTEADIIKYLFAKNKNKDQQLTELKAENESLKQQNKRVLDKLELMVDVDQENEQFKAENKRLNTELARKTTKINQFDEIIKDNYVDGQDYNKLKQQLKEKDEKIIHYVEEEQKYKREIDRRDKKIENQRKQLKANTHQVCEKIKKEIGCAFEYDFEMTYGGVIDIIDEVEKGKK